MALQGVPLVAPMSHAVLNGGKRLRAFLAMQSCGLYDLHPDVGVRAGMAIECMHAYSLVHDDLPCMDDDDLRRGQPTVHVKWDEATAVLVGDALQSLSFEALSEVDVAPRNVLAAVRALAVAAGARGMVLGQVQDIQAETSPVPLDLAQISELQSNKTGALIEWSACVGAVLAGHDQSALRTYARAIGVAFQIQDDVIDVEGDAQTAGKKLQKDADAGKATFVSLLGLENAKLRAKELVEQAQDALAPFGGRGDPLRHAAQFIITRKM
nr:farnesyl diphosphate synthase [Amylibacter marinus]